jgi:DNA (cytosine-5)-methyltransferase 1
MIRRNTPPVYYNEFDPFAAQFLRNLIADGLLPHGDVDDRDIRKVGISDVKGYAQAHFFAGIGGWPLALELAGWPVERPIWTGSCPCQPFSAAGRREGFLDPRDLWPTWFDLLRQSDVPVIAGEQVATEEFWLDRVRLDLEKRDFALGAAILPACSVDAPHKRDRFWFMAISQRARPGWWRHDRSRARGSTAATGGALSDADRAGLRRQPSAGRQQESGQHPRALDGRDVSDASGGLISIPQRQAQGRDGVGSNSARSFWSDHEWAVGADGKARRVKPGIRLLADGVQARLAKLSTAGNAIVPQVAAEFLGAGWDAIQECADAFEAYHRGRYA